MSTAASFASSAYPKVWVVAPSPPPYGGMSVQAEKLLRQLVSEGIAAELIPTNPLPPRGLAILGRIPGLRTVLREIQYLISLGKIVSKWNIQQLFKSIFNARLSCC